MFDSLLRLQGRPSQLPTSTPKIFCSMEINKSLRFCMYTNWHKKLQNNVRMSASKFYIQHKMSTRITYEACTWLLFPARVDALAAEC